MAFINNQQDPFRPSVDPFGGRGTQKQGLNHGGQYTVDYIVDGLKKSQQKASAPTPSRNTSAQNGQTPYLRNSPPVAAPKPTKVEEAKMKNVVGVDDVSTDNEKFVNIVSGSTKQKIEEGLADYTCWRVWQGGGKNCNYPARWALSQGDCNHGGIAIAKQKLEECTRAQGNPDDVAKCTKGKVVYSQFGADKRGRRLHVQETAKNWLNELESDVQSCLLKKQQSSGNEQNQSGYEQGCPSGTVYGCTEDTAINYDRCATYDDGSCEFGAESEGIDGTFGIDTGGIQKQLDSLFSQVQQLASIKESATPRPTPQPMMDETYYTDTTQASTSGGMNPLVIGGIVLIAGLALFLMNQKPAPVVMTRPPAPVGA